MLFCDLNVCMEERLTVFKLKNYELTLHFRSSASDSLNLGHLLRLELITRGQSNLTKSALRGPIPRIGVTPGGRNLYH